MISFKNIIKRTFKRISSTGFASPQPVQTLFAILKNSAYALTFDTRLRHSQDSKLLLASLQLFLTHDLVWLKNYKTAQRAVETAVHLDRISPGNEIAWKLLLLADLSPLHQIVSAASAARRKIVARGADPLRAAHRRGKPNRLDL